MNPRSATYHTAQEVANGVDYNKGKQMEDECDITTDIGDDNSEAESDVSDDMEFDDEVMGDYDEADDYMETD
jgi:hypothetical protein